MTRKFRPRIDIIKDENKEILSEGSKVMDRWKRYCEELYNKNESIETSHITNPCEFEREPLPTFSEIEKAMKEIKNGKSPGYDKISAEAIKNGGDNIIKFFHKLCVKIWNEKLWPDDWAKSVFIQIPKRGDTLESTVCVQ